MKKKILILGGAYQHCKLVRAAHALGLYTIVTDNLKDSPAKLIADEKLDINVFDVDKLVEYCKGNHVEGVLALYLDVCQHPYQQICERLRLPCYCNATQVQILTDKNKFKECCRMHGVDTIPSYELQSGVDTATVEYPVLVKPSESRGSRGQSVCNEDIELWEAVIKATEESKNGQVVIEKYMAGYQDFAVSYLFVNGEAYVTRTTDRYPGSAEFGFQSMTIGTTSPSFFTPKYMANVHPRVVNMLKSIGITNGPVFMQGFIDRDTVRFYDPGFRFPGSEYDVMFVGITKVDIVKLMVHFAMTGEMTWDYGRLQKDSVYLNNKQTFTLCPTLRQGTISRIVGYDEVSKFKEVAACELRYFEGDSVPDARDVRARFGEFDLIADNMDGLKHVILRIQEHLHVYDVSGQEMLINPLELSNIQI